jgi:hypothetical protein
MSRRIVLHIGLSKTGTTSIQRVLSRSRGALASQGVLYPDVAGSGPVDARMAPSLLRPQRPEPSHIALALELRRRKNDQRKTADLPLWAATFRQIEERGAHTTIISYENFYLRPKLYLLSLIKDQLREFHVHGVIYLRALEDWIPSLYSQMVKGNGRLVQDFSDFYATYSDSMRFSDVIDSVLVHLPLASLAVGDFNMAAEEDLIKDFLKKSEVHVDGIANSSVGMKSLYSLPSWATMFLLKCNRGRLPDDSFLDTRNALYRRLQRQPSLLLRPGLDVATPDERRGLRDIGAADADRLWNRHGVTLTQKAREPVAYRPFDDEDFRLIREAIDSELQPAARSALDRMAAR